MMEAVLWNRNRNRNLSKSRNRNFVPCGTGTRTVTCQKVGIGTGTLIKWYQVLKFQDSRFRFSPKMGMHLFCRRAEKMEGETWNNKALCFVYITCTMVQLVHSSEIVPLQIRTRCRMRSPPERSRSSRSMSRSPSCSLTGRRYLPHFLIISFDHFKGTGLRDEYFLGQPVKLS